MTLAGHGKRTGSTVEKTPAERHTAMTWAQRLKRVFHIDIDTCEHCGGAVKIIASIEDPTVIQTILDHVEKTARRTPPERTRLPAARAPRSACNRV